MSTAVNGQVLPIRDENKDCNVPLLLRHASSMTSTTSSMENLPPPLQVSNSLEGLQGPRLISGNEVEDEMYIKEHKRDSTTSGSWVIDNIDSGSGCLGLDAKALHPRKCKVRTKNFHWSRSAPAMPSISNTGPRPQRPQVESIAFVVKMAIIYLLAVVLFFCFNDKKFSGKKTNIIVDALYFSIVTMCTVGYGDIVPLTSSTKLLTCFFALLGFGFIKISLCWMVSSVLNKQESLLLNAVEGKNHEVIKNCIVDVKNGGVSGQMKVGFGLGVVILWIWSGTMAIHVIENLRWVDSFYLSVMSVTTVGYGDHAFRTLLGRVFACFWLPLSTFVLGRAILYFAEWVAKIDRRQRLIAERVLKRDMTAEDLVAADMDHNGLVRKSEYVIYKLKEMGKVKERDIAEIARQFDRLDTKNCGKITLSLLSGL